MALRAVLLLTGSLARRCGADGSRSSVFLPRLALSFAEMLSLSVVFHLLGLTPEGRWCKEHGGRYSHSRLAIASSILARSTYFGNDAHVGTAALGCTVH